MIKKSKLIIYIAVQLLMIIIVAFIVKKSSCKNSYYCEKPNINYIMTFTTTDKYYSVNKDEIIFNKKWERLNPKKIGNELKVELNEGRNFIFKMESLTTYTPTLITYAKKKDIHYPNLIRINDGHERIFENEAEIIDIYNIITTNYSEIEKSDIFEKNKQQIMIISCEFKEYKINYLVYENGYSEIESTKNIKREYIKYDVDLLLELANK